MLLLTVAESLGDICEISCCRSILWPLILFTRCFHSLHSLHWFHCC